MIKLCRIKKGEKHQVLFAAGEGKTRWLGLEYLQLAEGEEWSGILDDMEAAVVILSGCCSMSIYGRQGCQWKDLGGRADVFSGVGTTIYVPRRSRFGITAGKRTEAAIAVAPCSIDLPPNVLSPSEVKVLSAGAANWRRDVRLIMPPDSGISQRLIVGETLNPQGNWSGIPPHKHDEISLTENLLEEFYLFKAKPVDGFGVQLAYGQNDKGEAHVVEDGDATFFPSGYHPTIAAPGVTLFYLWALSGDSKKYNLSIDARFQWISSAESVLRELKRM